MKKINKITPEIEDKIQEYFKKGLAIGLNTDEADWDKADDVIRKLYDFIKKNNTKEFGDIECKKIYHVESPVEAQKLITELTGVNEYHNNYVYGYGQFESYWTTYFNFYKDVFNLEIDEIANEGLEIYTQLAESSGWHYLLDDCAIICNKMKTIKVDDENKKHCEDGPAIESRDGLIKIYAIHDHEVPAWIVEEPEKITIDSINKEANAETKRIMMDIFGIEKYLTESGVTYLDMDAGLNIEGSAPRFLVEDNQKLKWLIGSDGSTKRTYFMPVPDEVTTCKQAHETIAGVTEDRIIAES